MKKGFLLTPIFVLILFLAGNSFAYELSADVQSKYGGQTSQGKFYVKNNKVRMEMGNAQEMVTIVRSDLKKTWIVQPRQKMYMESALNDARQVPQEKMQGEVTRKLIGSEKIDGHPTNKYEVTYKDGENTNRMYQWMATDIKFPVKQAATDGSWSIEYKNIKMSSQPDSLFEIPAGYQKMTMPGMPQGFNPNAQQRKSKKRTSNE